MTELAALNVKISGDSSQLNAAVTSATGDLAKLATAANVAGARVSAAGASANNFGRSMGAASGQTANLTFQLQDIAMMLAAGQNPLMLAMQQGSQVSGVFMQMGATAKTVGPAIASAFAGLLNPLSLLTIGTIAAVGAVTQLAVSFFTASGDADKMSEAAERNVEVLNRLTETTRQLRLEQGMLFSGAETTAEQEAIERLNQLLEERAAIEEKLDGYIVGNARAGAYKYQLEYQRDILDAEIERVRAAIDAENAARQGLETSRLIKGMMDNVATAAGAAAAATSGIENSARGALGAVQSLAAAMWDVAAARQSAQNSVDQFQAGGLAAQYQSYGQGRVAGERRARESGALFGGNAPALGRSGGGGGGGGGGSAADSAIQSELEAIQQGLLTQEQLQMESFARQQEVLQQSLAQRLITQEEYANLMQHAQNAHEFAMGQSVRDGAQGVLSAMGQLFEGSKKIGAGIALANSWLAFTEVLKDPSYVGRPWARFAAAAQALAAGMNAVRNIQSAGRGGASGGGAVASQGQGQSQAPMQVMLNTYGAGDMIRGADFGMILDRLNSEAGDRGYNLMWARS